MYMMFGYMYSTYMYFSTISGRNLSCQIACQFIAVRHIN